MPGKSGFDAAKEILALMDDGDIGDIPILAFSADDTEDTKDRA
eukprot:CAMPEP_0114581128 /NCGR_PEP_ID=MMETSP0125-20121206/5273_1 /TAXON_ID=485358 ORGANISM="Aristerostoma sp., Strain ATCC 50986" /NCGR_SAMPLE_ID=MMETSP0125 /ASSEMBLY_ACC=CAM_ASM_000245 /LENGTH=42 /DNA_ID= /DNA_START= /DNA_END= /DNA_ORIENTATION=